MTKPLSRKTAIGICILITMIAGSAASYLAIAKPTIPRETPPSLPPLVEIITVSAGAEIFPLLTHGTIEAAQPFDLVSEVSGKIIWLAPEMVLGGRLRAGQPLVRIDPRNLEIDLTQKKSTLKAKEVSLLEEVAKGKNAAWEFAAFAKHAERRGAPPLGNKDLALRTPYLVTAQADLSSAQSSVRRAQIELERARLVAPFNAIVLTESLEKGQVIKSGAILASLAGTDAYWVRVALPLSQLRFLKVRSSTHSGSLARVLLGQGHSRTEWTGEVIRVLADLSEAGQLAQILVEIESPLGEAPTPSLFINSFVDVEIDSIEVQRALSIPSSALHREAVWLVSQDNRLQLRPVQIIRQTTNSILVQGLSEGNKVVTRNISTPNRGLRVRIAPQRDSSNE